MNVAQYSEVTTHVVAGDVSEAFVKTAYDALVVAVDIETTGLDWANDIIASVQVAIPSGLTEIVRIDTMQIVPNRLVELLTSVEVLKIFHHAMFDLRFIRHTWSIRPVNVACTKVAAKLRHPAKLVGHSLVDLLAHYLGVEIDKSEQQSDWKAPELSAGQVDYAANDVRYLVPLLYALLSDLRRANLEELTLRCFDHIPARVELEVRGFADVFTY